jgi:hypothetical protein
VSASLRSSAFEVVEDGRRAGAGAVGDVGDPHVLEPAFPDYPGRGGEELGAPDVVEPRSRAQPLTPSK